MGQFKGDFGLTWPTSMFLEAPKPKINFLQ